MLSTLRHPAGRACCATNAVRPRPVRPSPRSDFFPLSLSSRQPTATAPAPAILPSATCFARHTRSWHQYGGCGSTHRGFGSAAAAATHRGREEGAPLEDNDIHEHIGRDLLSYRQAYDRIVITDSLERIVDDFNKVTMTGGQIVHRMLRNKGVEYVFGYSGGAVLPLVDCFYDEKIKFFLQCNEQCTGHSAAAVGKSTGKPGVVVVTSGPGLTNLITPLQDALMDGVPMVVLSGQVPTTAMGTDAFQECPATALTKPCTKWNFLAQDIESLPWALEHAFKTAMSGRKGPVHVDLPKNVSAGTAQIPISLIAPRMGQNDLAYNLAERENAKLKVEPEKMQRVADLIARAERPVMYVGHGASEAWREVRELAIKCDIPTTTTVHGMGIFDELHPLSLHMLGMHGSAYANYAIQNADLILAIGSRFDDRTTGVISKYAPRARAAAVKGEGGIVHIDIEARQFGKCVEPNLAIHSDCRNALLQLLPLVSEQTRSEWVAQIQKWKQKFPFSWIPAPEGRIKTQDVCDGIYRATRKPDVVPEGKDVIYCTGVGNHQMMTAQFIRWRRPRQMITSGGLGTMGSGLPFSIGAQVSHPDSLVILIDGDGSFNMTHVDLASVRRYNLPIKIAIMNDGKQQMVAVWQKLFFNGRMLATDNTNPDYVMLANSHGVPAVRCSHVSDLDKTIAEWLSTEGPCLADFRVVPDICLPMVQPGRALDEMLLNPEQLENAKMEGLAPS
ncbi:unnamed protein product [Vitrella brassicaformis CCMP3155]|uniref:Acetolactate synthase n=1 Tax=Vitrella brassicaformis (strain CCMP3155) TaxID=1169540 RepID=A0A0G4F5M5_VITBC|nr:unnamed protein product [Vitrella brassicaformis CCMP3155]|eukprot:CEM07665.1 unnamed protein product [Vitrella brassicaformis CCMP3155]